MAKTPKGDTAPPNLPATTPPLTQVTDPAFLIREVSSLGTKVDRLIHDLEKQGSTISTINTEANQIKGSISTVKYFIAIGIPILALVLTAIGVFINFSLNSNRALQTEQKIQQTEQKIQQVATDRAELTEQSIQKLAADTDARINKLIAAIEESNQKKGR